jgi:hypothetical protein
MSNGDENGGTQQVYGVPYGTEREVGKYVQQVLILDVDAASTRFLGNPFLDAVVNPQRYVRDAIFYLSQGLYEPFYYNVYVGDRTRILDNLFTEANGMGEEMQQNHRNMSVGDMAVLTDHSVWVLTGPGWVEINAVPPNPRCNHPGMFRGSNCGKCGEYVS